MKHVKSIVAVSIILLALNFPQISAQEDHGFRTVNTASFQVEVSASLPRSMLTEAQRAVLLAEQFFSKIFKMPAGMLTGNFSEGSIAFSKFKEKLKSDTSFGGKVPKNLYEEWFNLSGKIEYRIWEKRKDFGNEFFDFFNVPNEERAKRGLPGAYFAWGRLGGTKDADPSKQFGKRIIRSYVEGRDPKEVVASLYHEIGHLYLGSYLMAFYESLPPAWLSEGFAELFAYGLPTDAKTRRAKNRNRAILYELVQTNEYWEFKTFLTIDNAHNLKLVELKSIKSEIVYTQAWSLVEFLTSSSEHSNKFLKFLDILRMKNFERILKRQKTTFFQMQGSAFKEAFNTDIDELESFWVKYVNRIYKAELTRNPENHYFIGDFYLRRNNVQKAEEFFAIAVEKAPKHSESHLGLGRLAYKKGAMEDAEAAFLAAVNADKENEEALSWLGYAQYHNKKYAEAVDSFKKSNEINSESVDNLYGYGLSLLKTKQYKESQSCFDQAYKKSGDPKHLFHEALALFYLKEYTESRRKFSAVSVALNNAEVHFWLGVTSAHLGEKDYAISELEKASNNTDNTKAAAAKAFLDALKNGKALPELKE